MTYSTTTKPLCNSCQYWVDHSGCIVKYRGRNPVNFCDNYSQNTGGWKKESENNFNKKVNSI